MYNQVMAEQVLKGKVTSWCGTNIEVEVRLNSVGEMYFQKIDTELPANKFYVKRVKDACARILEKIEEDEKRHQ